MIMENRSKRLSEPLRWGRREKTVVAVLRQLRADRVDWARRLCPDKRLEEPKDCVDITFASTLGAAHDARLWRARQDLCAAPQASKEIAQPLKQACRRAGYPFE